MNALPVNRDRLARGYLALLALAVALWWLMLALRPSSRAYFLAPGAPDSTLLAFALPDLAGYVALPLALAALWRTRWRRPLAALHAGAAFYATLYCWNLALTTGGAWAGALAMAPTLAGAALVMWHAEAGEATR